MSFDMNHVFPSLARVQPHNLIYSATLERIVVEKMKEEEGGGTALRGGKCHCSRP